MVMKVYFESSAHAELVATFEGDDYPSLFIAAELERLAEKERMIVTESVE